MEWLVRHRRRPDKWFVRWAHRTETSSWWGELVVDADTAEEAAAKVLKHVDFEKHTSYRNRTMPVRVYGPIPEEGQEFNIAPSTAVEVVPSA